MYKRQVKVVVKQRTTGIEISKSKLTKKVGNMFKLSATVKPSNAYNKAIYWTSSNVAVASVDEFGIVTCHKKGKATITALTTDGYGAKCKLTVKKGKTKICLLYTSDAADDLLCGDFGGRRIINKKNSRT